MIKLYIGTKFTGITIEPDSNWPGMWRIQNKGHVSDMVNLARAKDAAITWAHPTRKDVVSWREYRERAAA
jgi:hypothetical protein